MYSLPTRNNDVHGFEHIPLRDLNQPQHIERRIKHEETNKRSRWWRNPKFCLWPLLFIPAILAVVFIPLYAIEKNRSSEIQKNGTIFTSIITTTTSIPGKASTSTQPSPPVTQTAVRTETEVSYITTEITKTSVLTTTDATRITVKPTTSPPAGKRCNNSQQYGGQELHDINSDYDLLLAAIIQDAVNNGLDIGGAQVLDVGKRSVFLCTSSPSIELKEACESGFEHVSGGVSCNSGGSYPTRSATLTDTQTKTSTSLTRRRRTVT